MNRQLKRIDPEVLLKCTGQDEATTRRLIAMFLKLAPELFASLENSLSAGDAAQAAQYAHSLKGSLDLIGARALADALDKLERGARRGALPSDPELRAFLSEEMKEVIAEAGDYLQFAAAACQSTRSEWQH
jgi:HPt (histidine-containing phosphotransfer) domain-containing protein